MDGRVVHPHVMAMTTSIAELSALVAGTVLEPGQPGYDQEVAGFNAAVAHRPELVIGASSEEDVVQAVRFARARGWRVAVQSTGHGAQQPVEAGLLVTTRRIDHLHIDAAARGARVGAGARWGAVVASAAPHRLAPIAGSSPTVGVVGLLLGGGIGPLVRSHGFGSDYLVGATLVTGNGDVVRASTDEHPDILWALRGGKPGLGVVTEVRLQLVDLPALYAGALFFEEAHIEGALRAWIAWTAQADPRVTTSVAIVRFPPLDALPPHLRGRRLLTLRFAYPGDATEGARLAAPLRAIAPVYLDKLGALPIADVAHIFDDPPGPVPAWSSGGLLASVDQELASALLRHLGAGTDGPFLAAEIRQLGEAAARDVPGGSAAGGRGARFTLALIGTNPAAFATVLPEAEARLVGDLARWLSPEGNGNFAPHPGVRRTIAAGAGPAIRARLADLRRRYDPDGLFGSAGGAMPSR
jgi:FAD/FMN-containing dehydrogenase